MQRRRRRQSLDIRNLEGFKLRDEALTVRWRRRRKMSKATRDILASGRGMLGTHRLLASTAVRGDFILTAQIA